jgi:RHS repeat-associated protein
LGGELLAEYMSTAPTTPTKQYGYQGGKLLIVAEGTALRWLVSDHLGSTRMEVGQAGSLASVTRHDYMPFGEETFAGIRRSGNTGMYGYESQPPASTTRQRFVGYERDNETNLDFAQARYFSNVQGRFTSTDPLMASATVYEPQSWNRYTYVQNNPCKKIDPTGMTEVSAEDCAKNSRCVTVKLNVTYDTTANKGSGLTDKEKAKFEKEQIQSLKNEYGEAIIRFEVTKTDGKLTLGRDGSITGYDKGALNVIATKQNLGGTDGQSFFFEWRSSVYYQYKQCKRRTPWTRSCSSFSWPYE